MGPSKIKRALGAMKDQTSIGLARVGSSNSLSDLDVAIVKATRHGEHPAEEKHIREIVSLTSYSRTYISACVNALSRRLNKTKNWMVALKTLILIQRLIADGDPAYEQEIFFATRRGTRLLNMSDFRDTSRSNSWDYSAFVRTFALYLDERLEFKMQGRRGRRSGFGVEEEDDDTVCLGTVKSTTPVRELKTDHVFSRMLRAQQLLERFLACRPTGGAKNNRVVIVALNPIVKESFQIYYEITEISGVLIDRFMELEIPELLKAYEIFCRSSKQLDELDNFYKWSRSIGIARSSEFPEIEKVTHKKLELMDEFIRDKSALGQTKRVVSCETKNETYEAVKEPETPENNAITGREAEPTQNEEEEDHEANRDEDYETNKEEEEKEKVDFLNMEDDSVSAEEQANQMALALFDGSELASHASAPTWVAFNDDATDWETALVQSATTMSRQKTAFTSLLDGMYERTEIMAVTPAIAYVGGGNGSSNVAAMLALPAPPGMGSGRTTPASTDPFAASLTISPPPYVQMSDMEKKHQLLVEEQLMWQQYARGGMQGQAGLSRLQPNSFNT